MQEAIVAVVVVIAAAVLARKIWRAVMRRCRPKGKDGQGGCDKCCKCG